MPRLVLACLVACAAPSAPAYPVHRATTAATGEIAVIGQVVRPSVVAYRRGMRLRDAIAAAGGFTRLAWRSHVRLAWRVGDARRVASVNVTAIDGGRAPDPELAPGDLIFVEIRD